MYLFSNILGVFVFDEEFKVVDEITFNSEEDYQNKEKIIDNIKYKYNNIQIPDKETLNKILLFFKKKDFFSSFYNQNLQLTKFQLKNSVSDDILLIQAINSIGDLDKAINLLVKRLREWYELYNPEYSVNTESHEKFVEEILKKDKNELLEEININGKDSIGADLRKEDIEAIKILTNEISNLYDLKKHQVYYITLLMDKLCPNIKAVCGAIVGAKLIEHAGSLKRLSEMPASTVQILGAEKALFRHMTKGSKPPKHGIIVQHPLIARAPDKMHGKIARSLADKISIAAKVDFFKGKFIGDKLLKDLEEKFNPK